MGNKFLFHLTACGLTFVIIRSGFDWFYFQSTRGNFIQILFFPSIFIGYITPFFLPGVFYVIGLRRNNYKILNVAFATGQTTLISFIIFATYKGITGRAPPPLTYSSGLPDTSSVFHFGLLHNSIVWGWPSGHAMWACAMATTLWVLYPNHKVIKHFSLLYALYISLGMSVNLHWLSDVVAGAFIGVATGLTVGRSFALRR